MSEWISVKDKLPEKLIDVLCFNGTYFTMDVLQYWDDDEGIPKFYDLGKLPGFHSSITHWMPLPKRPAGFQPSITHWMPMPKPPEES